MYMTADDGPSLQGEVAEIVYCKIIILYTRRNDLTGDLTNLAES